MGTYGTACNSGGISDNIQPVVFISKGSKTVFFVNLSKGSPDNRSTR